MKRIVIAGHLSLDHIKTCTQEKSDVPGGAALYTSVAASLYGGDIRLLSTRCADFDRSVLRALEGRGIGSEDVIDILGEQRRSFMEYSRSFSRVTHSHARKIWLDCTIAQTPRHLPSETADALYLAPMLPSVQLQYARWAKEQGLFVCADTSEFFAEHDASSLKELAGACDVFMPSDVELNAMYPEFEGDLEKTARQLFAQGNRMLVVKQAAQGCSIFDFSQHKRYAVGIRSTEVVDATGAGDSYNGAFLSAWLNGESLSLSARYAAAVASLCIEQFSYSGVQNASREQAMALAEAVPVQEEEWL